MKTINAVLITSISGKHTRKAQIRGCVPVSIAHYFHEIYLPVKADYSYTSRINNPILWHTELYMDLFVLIYVYALLYRLTYIWNINKYQISFLKTLLKHKSPGLSNHTENNSTEFMVYFFLFRTRLSFKVPV